MRTEVWIQLARRVTAPSCRPFWVLAISGLLGFRVGIVGYFTWAVPVESAQVVAGLVQYPAGNPFYVYHTKLWTLVIQICAVLLRAGVSEIALSMALSGILGMVSFQALSMIVYALGRDAPLAIGAAFVVFFSRAAEHGVAYPVFLMGTHHTYGALGLSTFVLAAGLIGAGLYRTGGFLLGVAPAVHPSLGVWVGLTMALAFCWDFRKLREEFRPALKYLLAGGAVTAVSLLVQLTLIYDAPEVDPSVWSRHFYAFLGAWDDHRGGTLLSHPGVMLNRVALALALIWLLGFSDGLPRSAVFLLRVIAVSGALGLASVVVSWVPPERVPPTLSILMAPRLLNFNVLALVPLVLGLLGTRRGTVLGPALTAALLIGLVLSQRSMFWDWVQEMDWRAWETRFDQLLVVEAAALGLVLLAMHASRKGGAAPRDSSATATRRGGPARVAAAITRAAALAVALLAAALTWRVEREGELRDRTNDPFFREIAADRRGLVVTAGSFQLVQLYTRRPVLIDSGGLDTMVYAPETGPAMARILRDVYDLDLFDPPREVWGGGRIPHEVNRDIWARFSRERWREIRRAYNVTQVVTRAEYTLDLPVAAETAAFRLYRIPD